MRAGDGMTADYDHIQKLKPRRSPKELPAHISLGYDDFFRASCPIFKQLAAGRSPTGLKFQLGIPTGFAMGFAFASQIQWLRHTGAFNTILARQVNRALAEAGDDVIVQLELPPELYAAGLLPGPLRRLALRPVHDILAKSTPGAQTASTSASATSATRRCSTRRRAPRGWRTRTCWWQPGRVRTG